MTTYPQGNTDWVGKDWYEPTPHTTMTIRHYDDQLIAFVYCDINGRTHLLTKFDERRPTFTWGYCGKDIPELPLYNGPVDPHLLKLAYSWLEYLDAVVEKE